MDKIKILEKINKVFLVFIFSIYSFLIGYNNIIDYQSNFDFVKHVLLMDTTFSNNLHRVRAISSPFIHVFFFYTIILTELLISVFTAIGGFRMFVNIKNDSMQYNNAKFFAILGLMLGIILWFFFFIIIGGEWFVMWQSVQWNGLMPARFMLIINLILLIYVTKND